MNKQKVINGSMSEETHAGNSERYVSSGFSFSDDSHEGKYDGLSAQEIKYMTTLESLHGTRKLDYLKLPSEKVTELFRQMDVLLDLVREDGVSDIDYISSLDEEMNRLREWSQKNVRVFKGGQYSLYQKKSSLFDTLIEGKMKFISGKEKREMEFEIRRLKGLIEHFRKLLAARGIRCEMRSTDDFKQDEWYDALWDIIDTSMTKASAMYKLRGRLDRAYLEEWRNNETIMKFYDRSLATINMYVSEERFRKSESAGLITRVSKETLNEMCDELSRLERSGDLCMYNERYCEYSCIAEESGLLQLFKKLTGTS